MPRQIIEEPLYASQIDKLRINWERLDEAMITLEPALLNVPDIFPMIPGTTLRRVKLAGFPQVPPLSIYFAIKGDAVHLVAAELIDMEE